MCYRKTPVATNELYLDTTCLVVFILKNRVTNKLSNILRFYGSALKLLLHAIKANNCMYDNANN